MAKTDLIQAYQSLASLVEQMHAAAEAQDWDQVFDLELLYVQQFEMIKQLEAGQQQPVPASQQAEKTTIIQRILAEEGAVKNLVKPKMDSLEQEIKGTQVKVKLNNTYVS